MRGDLGQGPRDDDITPLDAGTGPEVHEVVGRPHRVFVVLDDDDRVADVAKPFERGDQLVVVPRM